MRHKKLLWGMELSMDLKHCSPTVIRSDKKIKQFVKKLTESLGVKTYGECIVVDFGVDPRVSGYSMVQLIETSLISGHFVNKTNASYVNIFSCAAFDVDEAVEFTRRFFKAKDMEYIVNYRSV